MPSCARPATNRQQRTIYPAWEERAPTDRSASITQTIANEINAKNEQITSAVALLDKCATVPLIANYRKEATSEINDTQLRSLAERLGYLHQMDARRDAILKSIVAQGKLTSGIRRPVEQMTTKSRLEDIYRPFKPKRRTKTIIAREKGLKPLRGTILQNRNADPTTIAMQYLSKNVADFQEALGGARGILTEELAKTTDLLTELRTRA